MSSLIPLLFPLPPYPPLSPFLSHSLSPSRDLPPSQCHSFSNFSKAAWMSFSLRLDHNIRSILLTEFPDTDYTLGEGSNDRRPKRVPRNSVFVSSLSRCRWTDRQTEMHFSSLLIDRVR
ncbi:hypothetical protein J6590_043341 [Homalodisca vitripennis]|nr:hypothetical protein J6590_043341 [Homalodisca vitripennis]